MKIVKKVLMVLGGITALFGILTAVLLMIDDEESITEDEIALFRRMAEEYAHYIDNNIEIIPMEDMDYIPRDGIDYSSGDIEDAFSGFYGVAEGASEISSTNAVYNDGKGDIIVGKPVSSGTGGQKKPVYTGKTVKTNKKDAFREPDAWRDMGSVVIYYIYLQSDPGDNELPLEWSDPGDRDLIRKWSDPGDGDIISNWSDPGDRELYREWVDPAFWSDIGDTYLERADEFDYDAWIQFIRDEIRRYAQEVWGDRYDLSGIGDVIQEYAEEYVEEWSDPGDGSDSGEVDIYNDPGDTAIPSNIIKAEDFAINYKAMGRQFYREKLSKKQQLAYDVVATCIQRGEFTIQCELGITVDESKAMLDALLNDHPEFFFIRGYTYGATAREAGFNYTDESGITVGWAIMSLDEEIMQIGIDKALKDITSRAQPVIAKAKTIDSEIDRVRYIVEDLCGKNVYSEDGYKCRYGQNMYSAIVTNETVCAGFSKAFHYYMVALGVDATVLNSSDHMWNLLELDGEYYYMDVTWANNDSYEVYTDYKGVTTTTPIHTINHDFFNFNDAYLSKALEKAPKYKESMTRDYLGALLPAANGTKYWYKNWYGEDEEEEPYTPNNSETIKKEVLPAVPKDDTPKKPDNIVEDKTVLINGIDVSDRFDIIELNDILYADAELYIESFAATDMPEGMRYYNFHSDADAYYSVYDIIGTWGEDENYYVKDGFKKFLDMDVIIVESHFTENPIVLLFVDSNEALLYDSESWGYHIVEIEEAPRIVDGEMYMPMEAFAGFMEHELEID